MNAFLAGGCSESEGVACLPGGHGKAQEIGNKVGLELTGLEKAKSLSATSSLSRLLCGGQEMAPSEGPWQLQGSSPRAPQALSEAGLAQVSDPSCPRFSFLEGGGSRGWGRESAISILSGLLSPSLFVPRTPARTERSEEGSGGAGRRGRGGEPAGWCPPVSGAQAPGLGPARREASRSCAVHAKSRADSQPGAADGRLRRSPMGGEQIMYSLIRDRCPARAGEWLGWGVGLLSPLPLPPRSSPPPARLPARTHTHIS